MKKRFQKHRRGGNIHIFVEQSQSQAGGKRPFESLREWIGLIVASAGIFAALLYLTGHSFASGYFAAMNIPSYHVSFSIWEYGVNAWIPLFLFPIVMIILLGFLGGVFSLFSDWTFPLRAQFQNRLKKKFRFFSQTWQLPERSQNTKQWFVRADYAYTSLGVVLCLL